MKHPIRITPANRATLAARLRQYRRAGSLALLSVTAIKALSSVEARADHVARQIVNSARTDDTITDAENAAVSQIELAAESAPRGHALVAAYALSLAERNRLAADLGRAPVSLVLKRKPAPVADPSDEPLPAGYVAAPVEDYSPTLISDPEIDAQAAREAAEEIAAIEARDARDAALAERNAAAVAFVSDYDAHPIDTAPIVRHVNRVAVQSNAAAPRDPVSEHAALLAAVLGRAKPRKPTFRV